MPKNTEKAIIEKIKHIETFYEKPPPGTVKEYEERPEDSIPDTEANRKARDFLANAPSKGLWMPLGKEVKVMQCWKCKNYGHRTGDKECPLFTSGNSSIEKFRETYEDPMYSVLNSETRQKQNTKLRWLQQILDESTSSESDSSDSRRKKAKSSKKKKKKKEKWVEKKVESDSSDNETKIRKQKDKKHKSSQKEPKKHSNSPHKHRKRRDSSDDEIKHKKRKKHKKSSH